MHNQVLCRRCRGWDCLRSAPAAPKLIVMCKTMQITIIYLKDEMLISKINYESWREIQDEYDDYKTSLGPWSTDEVVEYLNDEYINLNPQAEVQVGNLSSGPQKTIMLTFND